eukprot:3361-Eustigmatos_ZCMA.PRE.1
MALRGGTGRACGRCFAALTAPLRLLGSATTGIALGGKPKIIPVQPTHIVIAWVKHATPSVSM